MIRIKRYATLGQADYQWLQARYHFSFAEYYDPHRQGFGQLRVVNDDVIMPGHGFGMHPHRDMEIITFIRKGAITHEDSCGNKGRTTEGAVQVMSAGSGVMHSEYNHEQEATHLYQIWIKPNKKGIKPRWEQRLFPREPAKDALTLLVSGDRADDALFINQNAMIYGGYVFASQCITQPIFQQMYLLVAAGKIRLGAQTLSAGDAAEIIDEDVVEIESINDSQLIAIDVPH